jgi:hypothetical protein
MHTAFMIEIPGSFTAAGSLFLGLTVEVNRLAVSSTPRLTSHTALAKCTYDFEEL